jgi:GNAT superfamily N-acetyltransferase
LLEVEGGGEPARHLHEKGGVALALLRLRPQARRGDQVLELLAEDLELGHPAAADASAMTLVVAQHHSDGALLEAQGHRREAAHAQQGMIVERRVEGRKGGHVRVRQGEAGLSRLPCSRDPAATRDGHRAPGRRIGIAGAHHHEGLPVGGGEEHADAVEGEGLEGALHEGIHALLYVHRAHHGHGDGVQRLGEAPPVLDVLEQARLGEGHRRVLGESLHHLGFGGRERIGCPREETHHPYRLVGDEERQQIRPDHAGLDEGGGNGGVGAPNHARGEILDDHRASRDGHLAHQPLPQRQLPPRSPRGHRGPSPPRIARGRPPPSTAGRPGRGRA